jgi:hypothetical protein
MVEVCRYKPYERWVDDQRGKGGGGVGLNELRYRSGAK